jgi:hypothetical protein
MTEQDERIIYEWLDKRLLGLNWQKFGSDEAGWEAIYERPADLAPRQRYGIPIPLLDMNFAFDVCVPKLRSEGVEVQYDKRGYWWLNPIDRTTTPIVVESDFYSALVAYIKGKA